MSNDTPNPFVDTYDPERANKRIEEATGKDYEEIRKEINFRIDCFKKDLQYDHDAVFHELNKLKQENERLKREINNLRKSIAK